MPVLKPELPDCFEGNGSPTSDPNEISNIFIQLSPKNSRQWCQHFDILRWEIYKFNFLGSNDGKWSKNWISKPNENKGNKSCGHDEISPKLVKTTSKYIVQRLTS